MTADICEVCEQFDWYWDEIANEKVFTERTPNNCSKWLCNDNVCPHYKQLQE